MTLWSACERIISEIDVNCDCDLEEIFGSLSDVDPPGPELSPRDTAVGEWLDAACDALANVTGHPVGRCTRTYAPCRDRCHYWDCPCGCSLHGPLLPGHDPEVTEVKINGVVLDPSEYLVIHDAGMPYLERINADGDYVSWPQTQAIRRPGSAENTFRITIAAGGRTDMIARNAAAEIACDILQYAVSDRDNAPDGVIAATGYGLTLDWRQFGSPTDQQTMRIAGMSWVQRFVATRPGGVHPAVFSTPGLRNGWTLYERAA